MYICIYVYIYIYIYINIYIHINNYIPTPLAGQFTPIEQRGRKKGRNPEHCFLADGEWAS